MAALNARKSARIAFVLYVFYTLLPAIPVFLPSIARYIVLILILLFSLLAVILRKKAERQSFPVLFVVLGILLLLLLQWLGEYSAIYSSFSSYFMNIILFWIPFFLSFEFENEDLFESNNYIILISIVIATTLITTIIGNTQYPEVSRLLAGAASAEESAFFAKLNIGGYKFVYGSVLLLPFWMYAIRTDKRIIPRILYITVFALTLYTSILTQYSLAIIIALLEIFLVFIFKGNKKGRIILIGLLILLMFVILRPVISEWIQMFANSMRDQGYKQIADRFQSIVLIINGNSAEGSTASRISLYQTSWESFLKNPILGNIFSDRPIGTRTAANQQIIALKLRKISVKHITVMNYLRIISFADLYRIFVYLKCVIVFHGNACTFKCKHSARNSVK